MEIKISFNGKCENRRAHKKCVRKTQWKGFLLQEFYFYYFTFCIAVVKRISRRQCLQSHTLIYAVAKGKTRVFSFTFPIPLHEQCFSFASSPPRTHLDCSCGFFAFAFAFAIIEFHLAIICGCFTSMSL